MPCCVGSNVAASYAPACRKWLASASALLDLERPAAARQCGFWLHVQAGLAATCQSVVCNTNGIDYRTASEPGPRVSSCRLHCAPAQARDASAAMEAFAAAQRLWQQQMEVAQQLAKTGQYSAADDLQLSAARAKARGMGRREREQGDEDVRVAC